MDNIVWKRVKPLSDSNTFSNFEKEYGILLPDFLKELIVNKNAGRPSLSIIKTADGNELEIKSLLSFNKEDVENIYNVIEYFKKEFEGKIIPIATEPSGDYFCIDLTNDSIFYWCHETNKLTFIAQNIFDFLKGLYKL